MANENHDSSDHESKASNSQKIQDIIGSNCMMQYTFSTEQDNGTVQEFTLQSDEGTASSDRHIQNDSNGYWLTAENFEDIQKLHEEKCALEERVRALTDEAEENELMQSLRQEILSVRDELIDEQRSHHKAIESNAELRKEHLNLISSSQELQNERHFQLQKTAAMSKQIQELEGMCSLLSERCNNFANTICEMKKDEKTSSSESLNSDQTQAIASIEHSIIARKAQRLELERMELETKLAESKTTIEILKQAMLSLEKTVASIISKENVESLSISETVMQTSIDGKSIGILEAELAHARIAAKQATAELERCASTKFMLYELCIIVLLIMYIFIV